MDRLKRDFTAPPYDVLAEAIVLRGLLYKPHLIAEYDPAALLVIPEHRSILAAMKRAHAATLGQSWGHFYVRWQDECGDLWDVLDGVCDDESRYQWREYEFTRGDRPGEASIHDHDWLWWYGRLRAIAECRQLVRTAQSVAERAWREDLDGARAALARVRPSAPAGLASRVLDV